MAERRGVRQAAVAPLVPTSTIEAVFIQYETAVALGELDYASAVRTLAQLALSEVFTLCIMDPHAWDIFSHYLERAVEERLRPSERGLPRFAPATRNVVEALYIYIFENAKRIAEAENVNLYTRGEVETWARQLASELVVQAAKAFFRFYGIMKWVRD